MSDPSAASVATAFREVMSRVATPVSVVTAFDGDRAHGTTVSAFASLSMDPPMMLVSLDRGSDLLSIIRKTRRFGVNVLAHDQGEIALRFARKGADKFTDTDWSSSSDLPRLHGAASWLACTCSSLVDGGDHMIALGEIIDATDAATDPLTYHARTFGTHRPLDAP